MNQDNSNILERSFYEREDVVTIGRELLGKMLVTKINGVITKGLIVETEAYRGRNDKACHANNGRRTKRTEVMYGRGGYAYVYLCYGIHHLFNVVTNVEGLADAVLIRALEPMEGEDHMKERLNSKNTKLTNGPGILSKALGITVINTANDLTKSDIWIEKGIEVCMNDVVETTRIGIDYAEEDASLPWRFYIKNNVWVSKY